MSIAPDYVTPEEVRDRQLKVYLTAEAGSVNLWPNANGDGFKLHEKADGLGVADSENTMTSLASGGAIMRHQRLKEGDMQLPIQIKSNSKRARNDLKTQLEQVLQPAKGPVYVHVRDPYSGDTRIRTAYYRTGLGQPEWSGPRSALYGVTLDYAEPWWRGTNRGRKVKVADRKKPFITARVKDLPEEEFAPSPATHADQWELKNADVYFFDWSAAADGKGLRLSGSSSPTAYGPFCRTKPGDVWTVSAYAGQYSSTKSTLNLRVYFYDKNKGYMTSILAVGGVGHLEGTVTAPPGAYYARYGAVANGQPSPGWLSIRDMGGSRQGGPIRVGVGSAIPFFPVFVYSSVVEGVYTLHIEGDEISWPTWYINPPGEDLLIENMTTGDKLFIEGEIFEPLTIVTDPHNQDIYSDTWTKGEWWNQVDVKQGDLFPLAAGENKIKITMVGATLDSYVEYSYQEMWRAPY